MEATVGARSETVDDALVGRLLDGRYRLDSTIARGGMATVYAATDTRLDRPVAVKVMRPALAEDPDFVERFAREARAAARLSSPEVVAVHDQGTDAATGTAYLVMERVSGGTLRDLLHERGPLPPGQALDLLEPVLVALAAAHAAGLVHRDVKPENVLLSSDGRVKVADFGLARAIETSNLTATTGMIIGTVAYLAPEQVEHGRTDTRTDVYAAGILLWELLTGAPPYSSNSPLSVAYRHVHDDVPAPGGVVEGIPAALDELVVRATRRDASARPVDAGAFLAELRAVRADLDGAAADAPVVRRPTSPTLVVPRGELHPPPPRSEPAAGPGRRRAWLAVTAVLLTALLGTGAFFFALTAPAPDVEGLTKVEAVQALQEAGFEVELLPSVFDEQAPPQHIVEQDPAAGSRLRKGGTVRLVNSLGPPVRTVPTVVGLSQDAAAAQLVKAGLGLGQVRQVFSEQPEGRVLESDPPVGARLKPGSKVALVVSKGVELLPVPEVVGQPQAAAERALRNAGLTAEITQAFSDEVPRGSVVSQSPASGSAPRGSAVELVVSKGPDVVTVPDLRGRTREQAVARLTELGLKPKVDVVLGFGPGNVLRTDPGGGKKVRRGSTVQVFVF